LKREGSDGGQKARLKHVFVGLYSNKCLWEQFQSIFYYRAK